MDNLEFETLTDIKTLLADQKCFFNTGKTKISVFEKKNWRPCIESSGKMKKRF